MKKNEVPKMQRYTKIEVYSEYLKELIMEYGKICGMDIDGDIIYYNNKKYFVDNIHNTVIELIPISPRENMYNIIKLICLYIAYICSIGTTFIFLEVLSLAAADYPYSLFDILAVLTVLTVSYYYCSSFDNEFIDNRLYPVYIFPNYKNAERRANLSIWFMGIFTILKKIAWAAVIASCILGFFFTDPKISYTLFILPICGSILRISYVLVNIAFQFMPNLVDLPPNYKFRNLVENIYKS